MSDVTTELRDAILRGEFRPRERLVEADLSERFGASRFNLRRAFTQLAGEGLVEIQPNRGARVREVTIEEAIEISEVRQVLEGLVARRAAELVDESQAAELQAIGVAMQESVASGSVRAYSELNHQLHSLLRRVAGHSTATHMIEELNAQLVRHQFSLSLVPGRPQVSLVQHLAIIDAVTDHAPDRSEAAMRDHLASVIAELRKFAADGDLDRLVHDPVDFGAG